MSKYTTEVRYICETYAGYTESQGFDKVEDIITAAAPHIFDDFEIYDENYRLVLEKKILRNYYTREISEETVGLWKLRLNAKMDLIMPFYNKLYRSSLLEFNPFYDVDLTRDYTRKDKGNNSDISSDFSVEKASRASEENNRGTSSDSHNVSRLDVETSERNKSGDGTKENEGNEIYKDTNTGIKTGNSDGTKENEGNESYKDTNTGVKSGSGREKENSEHSKNSTLSKSGSEVDSVNKWDYYSDTPQGGINAFTGADPSVQNLAYLTNVRHINDSASKTFNNRTDGTSESGESEANKENNYSEIVNANNQGAKQNAGSESYNDSYNEILNENKQVTKQNAVSENYNDNYSEIVNENNQGNKQNTGSESYNDNESETISINKSNNESNNINRTRSDDRSSTGEDNFERSSSGTRQSVITNMSDYIEHITGKQGGASYSELILKFRQTFINIDEMIIEELRPLFFGLW